MLQASSLGLRSRMSRCTKKKTEQSACSTRRRLLKRFSIELIAAVFEPRSGIGLRDAAETVRDGLIQVFS